MQAYSALDMEVLDMSVLCMGVLKYVRVQAMRRPRYQRCCASANIPRSSRLSP